MNPLLEVLLSDRDLCYCILPDCLERKDFVNLDLAIVNQEQRREWFQLTQHMPQIFHLKKWFVRFNMLS
jgi:hypothetical protein